MNRPLLSLLVFSSAVFFAYAAYAAGKGGWNKYETDSGLFSVEMPGEPVITDQTMRVSPSYEVYSHDILSIIDQRDYKRSYKSYHISATQTWGPGLNKSTNFYLKRDMDRYMKSFPLGKLNLQDSKIIPEDDYLYFYATYEDPDLGLQGIRTQVHYTNTMRVEQTVTGPNQMMSRANTLKFFDSLKMKRGYTKTESLFKEWEGYESKLGIFTMPHPYETSVYFPQQPNVNSDTKSEHVKMVFHDPIREQNMFYNIYAYRLNKKVTDTMVKQVLAKQHIRKYSPYEQNIQFKILQREGLPLIEHETVLREPPEKIPYLNTVKLRAQHHGNVMVIQELMGHHPLTRSSFARHLLGLIEFTPDRAIAMENGEPWPPEEAADEADEKESAPKKIMLHEIP